MTQSTLSEKWNEISNREKHIAAFLLLDIAVAVYYFSYFNSLPADMDLINSGFAAVVAKIIIFAAITAAILHLAIHGAKKPEPMDERDMQVDAKAMKAGYLTLLCTTATMLALLIVPQVEPTQTVHLVPTTEMGLANMFLMMLIVSNGVKDLVALISYRTSA